jgi:hypothetical protein
MKLFFTGEIKKLKSLFFKKKRCFFYSKSLYFAFYRYSNTLFYDNLQKLLVAVFVLNELYWRYK